MTNFGQVILGIAAGDVPDVEPDRFLHELGPAGTVVRFVERIHLRQKGGIDPKGEFSFYVFFFFHSLSSFR